MAKVIFYFVCMFLVLFGSSQSTSLQCSFSISSFEWGTLGKIYVCFIQDDVNITSSDAAQIDSISGTHLDGFNNDDVVAISVYNKAIVQFFPRGLNKFFKNLKGIEIQSTGLKEVHQSDLKNYPNLTNLWLWNSNLEVLEENLFEFTPSLEAIYLSSNNISHMHPNVFYKLTKLKSLWLGNNTCINMNAVNNPTELQNVIKTAKAQCINPDFSNLKQKVKNLLLNSEKFKRSENFKKKIEALENEIKNSKFANFFQENLKDLKAAVIEKDRKEFLDAISVIVKNNTIEMCSGLELKVKDGNDKLVVQDIKISRIEQKLEHIINAIERINKNNEDQKI